jgi:hypothetical protein
LKGLEVTSYEYLGYLSSVQNENSAIPDLIHPGKATKLNFQQIEDDPQTDEKPVCSSTTSKIYILKTKYFQNYFL